MNVVPLPIPSPYAGKVDIEIAKKLLGQRAGSFTRNNTFFEGDHWQNAEGWIGPNPTEKTPDAQNVRTTIESGFVFSNKVREIALRHRDGVVGLEPAWSWTPRVAPKQGEAMDEATKNLIAELDAILTPWWDHSGIMDVLKKLAVHAVLGGSGPARIVVPSGFVQNGKVSAPDIETALRYISLDAPTPGSAGLYTDPDTQQKIGVWVYQRSEDPLRPEAGSGETAEVTYVQDDGLTALAVIGQEGDKVAAIPLGGRLMHHEVTRSVLITDSVLAHQKALNLALSMIPRNVTTGGFLERIILNGQMPGKWVEDKTAANGKRFVAEPFYTGPGATSWITGASYQSKPGEKALVTPQVVFRDPVPVTSSVEAAHEHYAAMLEETHQAHVLTDGAATPTGVAREVARADFERSLKDTALPIASLVQWYLETALALAEAIAGAPGKYTSKLRAVVTVNVDPGPISPDERRANDESVKAGTMARETSMVRAQIADTDAEIAKINADVLNAPEVMTRRATAVSTFVTAGADLEDAARVAGLSEEQVQTLVKNRERAMEMKAKEAALSRPAPGQPGAGGAPSRPSTGERSGASANPGTGETRIPRATTRAERAAGQPRPRA